MYSTARVLVADLVSSRDSFAGLDEHGFKF
jgi:hypothetical protein